MRPLWRTTALAGLGAALLLLGANLGGEARGHGRLSAAHSAATSASLAANASVGTQDREDVGGPTRVFMVENDADARAMAAAHATAKGELLFTTYQFSHKGAYSWDAIHQAKHLWENLREVGILRHTIVLSYDVHSCQVMWEHGIPCFLDRHLLQPDSLPGQYGADGVPHWYQKYAWALKFIEMGYVTVFVEMDMVFLENPLAHYNPYNDLEGLSDWRRADLGTPKDRFTNPCAVYHMQKGDNDNALDWGPHDAGSERSSYHINACMSTGFWFIQPTKPARELLASFTDLQLHWRNWQIDQVLWNEVLMAFLIGSGRQRPLHFSLLDTARFSNFEVWEKRKEAGLRVSPVMLHAGAISGSQKEAYMRAHGFWRADAWNGTGAAQHISQLSQTFQRRVPPG